MWVQTAGKHRKTNNRGKRIEDIESYDNDWTVGDFIDILCLCDGHIGKIQADINAKLYNQEELRA